MHFPTLPLSRSGKPPAPTSSPLATTPLARRAPLPSPLPAAAAFVPTLILAQAAALALLLALSFATEAATGGEVAIFEGLQSEVDANVFGPLARVGIALCGLAGLVFMMLGKFLYGFMGVAGGGGLYFTDQIVNSPAFSATLDLLDRVQSAAS